jgi:WD40 repeat protein
MLLRLVQAARLHQANEGSLWRGPELRGALKWLQSTQPTPAWVGLYTDGDGVATWQSAKSFIDESRWRGWLRSAALAPVPIAVILAVVAFQLFKRFESRARANDALLVIGQDPAQSARLALKAVEWDQDNEQGVYALQQSLATLEVAHAEWIHNLGDKVSDVQYSLDGSLLITASGKTVTIFDSKTFERVQAIARDENVRRAWLIGKNKILVTQTADGRAQIQRIDSSASRPIACAGGAEKNPVYTINVSPNDRHVALGCLNGDVLVWDATDPSPRPKHAYSHSVKGDVTVTALAFSSDGAYLASGDADGTVNLWKLGYPTAWIGVGGPGTKDSPIRHAKAIRDIGFYRDDPGLLVTGADNKQAIVWRLDLDRQRLEEKFKPLEHERPVIAAKFTAPRDGEYPVITVSGKNAQLWVNPTADPKQVRAHDDWINDANASPDGDLLVTASADGTARIWSTRSGAPIAVLRGHTAQVNRAVFRPKETQVVTASNDGSVRAWRFRAPRLLAFSKGWAYIAVFEPEGMRVAVGEEYKGGILELNDFAGSSMPVRHDLPATKDRQISRLSWSKNRKVLVGTSSTYDIHFASEPVLWDVDTKRDITPGWLKKWRTAVFNPGTDELLTVSEEGQIAVWDMKSLGAANPQPKLKFGEEPKERGRWMAAMSPDGGWIAALNGKKVDLWKRDDPQAPPRELVKHGGDIMSLQFSRDSKWLLTASKDRTARIWPIDRPDLSKELKGGHTAALSWASFDPSGERVVTGSADGTIGVWNAEKAMLLASLRWHSEGVNSVEFSPNGEWILSASDDGTVKLGQCEACALTLKELRKRVPEFAKQLE